MAGFSKSNKAEDKVNYEAEVTRAVLVKDVIMFDMKVNGVSIYGCCARKYKNSAGDENTMISFPSRKAEVKGETKWYSHAWFPMSAELKDLIIAQCEKMI